jgi:hypothetical protein
LHKNNAEWLVETEKKFGTLDKGAKKSDNNTVRSEKSDMQQF